MHFVVLLINSLKVQQKIIDLRKGIKRIVSGKHTCGRGVIQQGGVRWRGFDKPCDGGLCTRNRIVARTTMHEVVPQASVKNISTSRIISPKVDTLFQTTSDVGHRSDQSSGQGHIGLNTWCRNSVKRFCESVSAGKDATIISQNAIFSVSSEDPIASLTSRKTVVLTITKEHVVTRHPMDDVISGFSMNLIT